MTTAYKKIIEIFIDTKFRRKRKEPDKMKKIAAVSLGVIAGIVTGGISAFQVGRVKIAKYKELEDRKSFV